MPREITRIEVPEPEPMHPTDDGGAETQGAAYRLSAPAVATEPLTVTAPDGTALTWVPTELCYRDESGRMDYIVGSAPAGVHVRDREARYQRTFPVADDVFLAEAERVKHWVILHEPPREPAEYLGVAIEFGVTGLVSGVTLPEGRHDAIEAGPFRLPRPVARDLTGREINGYYEVLGAEEGQQLFMWFPAQAILQATYPVMLDPTVATAPYTGPLKVAIAPDGSAYVAYRTSSGIAVARSSDGGQTWQTSLSLSNIDLVSDYDIAATSNGRVHLIYAQTRYVSESQLPYECSLMEMVYANGSWQQGSLTGAGTSASSEVHAKLAIFADERGNLHLAYRFYGPNLNRSCTYRVLPQGGSWSGSTPTQQPSSAPWDAPVGVMVTGSGQVIILLGGMYCVLQSGGSTFGPWQTIPSASGTDHLTLARDETGTVHMIGRVTTGEAIRYWGWTGSGWSTRVDWSALYPLSAVSAYGYGARLRVFGIALRPGEPAELMATHRYEDGTWLGWSMVYSSSANPVQSVAAVRQAVNGRGLFTFAIGNQSPYIIMADVSVHNTPPLAPVLGTRDPFDASESAVFTWAFSDSAGDFQSAYQLQIKRASDGTVVYDTGKVVSSAQQHTLPGGTLQNGAQYRWTVRTWDQYDAAGQYATEQAFVTSARPTVAITDPASDGAVIVTSSYAVQWVMSDPEGKGQSAYQVVLKDGGGNVVHDSGKVPSTTARAYTLQNLQNNTSYTVELTVWDGDGVASGVATLTFQVQYTPPPTPDITIEGLEAWVRITIANNNSGAEVQAVSNDVYRRKVGEAGNSIRIATNVPVDGVVYDYAVASGVAYEYRVVAIGSNGTTAASAWVQAPVLKLTGAWIHDPADPPGTLRQYRVAANPQRGEDWEPERALLQFAGRALPVAEFGEAEDRLVRFSVLVRPDRLDELEALRALAARRSVVCYRDSAGRRIFGTIGPLRIRDERHGGYTVDLEITAVDYDEAV